MVNTLPPNHVSPAKSPRVAFYPPPEIKEKLEKLASLERRSISQMALLLVEEGLERAQNEGKFNESKEDRSQPQKSDSNQQD